MVLDTDMATPELKVLGIGIGNWIVNIAFPNLGNNSRYLAYFDER